MVKDRWKDFAAQTEQNGDVQDVVIEFKNSSATKPQLDETDKFLAEMKSMHSDLEKMKEDFQDLKKKYRNMQSLHQNKESGAKLRPAFDDLSHNLRQRNIKFSAKLKAYRSDQQFDETLQTYTRLKLQQVHSMTELYKTYLDEFLAFQHECNQLEKEGFRRDLAIVGKDITEEELEEKLEAGEGLDAFTSNVSQQLASEMDVLDRVNERHNEILKLEKSILELSELFKEMNQLVKEQGESVDTIERYVVGAADKLDSANEQLVKAKENQSKARKKKVCLITVAVIIALVIIGIIVIVIVQSNSGE